MTQSAQQRVPAHLKRFCVQQAYAQYNEVDQAIWRFVLLQNYDRLKETAHPAYAEGLKRTGMSVERIPRIEQMDRCLSEFGWGAVCVDGFIAPRAFQEFQALGILPIAADIRTVDHLAYTPAPDIIHEAAGHAPILPDQEYASYLRSIGAVGKRAFSSPEDDAVYNAIYALSAIKEDPASTPERVHTAELVLDQALSAVSRTTEAAKMSRLYWWTAEYGLVGKPEEYKLYGAGLLSSLGESHSCHDPSVRKIPLSAGCTEVDYDITRPQPQLFVAEDFAQLRAVLEEVETGLAYKIGGAYALDMALQSGEVATIEFTNQTWVTGILNQRLPQTGIPAWLEFRGRTALFTEMNGPAALDLAGPSERGGVVVGVLEDGRYPSQLSEADLRSHYAAGDKVQLRYRSGIHVEGYFERMVHSATGALASIRLKECRIVFGADQLLHAHVFDLVVADEVRTAFAGAASDSYFPETQMPEVRVPRARSFSAQQRELIGLFEQARDAYRSELGNAVVSVFEQVHARLLEHHSNEWLLRWNLLESLVRIGAPAALTQELIRELTRLEIAYERKAPIASGLRYLNVS